MDNLPAYPILIFFAFHVTQTEEKNKVENKNTFIRFVPLQGKLSIRG